MATLDYKVYVEWLEQRTYDSQSLTYLLSSSLQKILSTSGVEYCTSTQKRENITETKYKVPDFQYSREECTRAFDSGNEIIGLASLITLRKVTSFLQILGCHPEEKS